MHKPAYQEQSETVKREDAHCQFQLGQWLDVADIQIELLPQAAASSIDYLGAADFDTPGTRLRGMTLTTACMMTDVSLNFHDTAVRGCKCNSAYEVVQSTGGMMQKILRQYDTSGDQTTVLWL